MICGKSHKNRHTAYQIFDAKLLQLNQFSGKFDTMGKDFKSDMSTIPSHPQGVDFEQERPTRKPQNRRTQRPKRTQDVGTVAQFPAQQHLPIPQYALTDEFQADFWSKVNRTSGCWEWQGNLGKDSYGRLRIGLSRAQLSAQGQAHG